MVSRGNFQRSGQSETRTACGGNVIEKGKVVWLSMRQKSKSYKQLGRNNVIKTYNNFIETNENVKVDRHMMDRQLISSGDKSSYGL